MMDQPQAQAHARAVGATLGIPMDDERVSRVVFYLALTARMVDELERVTDAVEVEPAEVFCPAPFPATDPADDPQGDAAAGENGAAR